MPILSFIIVNYNTKELLRSCLESVFQKTKGIDLDVFVADNNSSDGSQEMLKNEFPRVKTIANKENLGFAKANNLAIKKSQGNYIFLLNPDTIVLDENIKEVIDFMEKNPEIGAVGPLVLNKDRTMQKQCKRGWPTFWNAFTYYSGLWKLFPQNKWWKRKFGGYFLLEKPNDRICEVDCLSGAAMILRSQALEQAGLMPEDYVMYWEDIELCFKIKKSGWKIYYFPFFRITHYGGAGGSQIHAAKNLWYFHRGAFIFYKKFLANKYFFLIDILYYSGICLAFASKLLLNLFRGEKVIGSKKPS